MELFTAVLPAILFLSKRPAGFVAPRAEKLSVPFPVHIRSTSLEKRNEAKIKGIPLGALFDCNLHLQFETINAIIDSKNSSLKEESGMKRPYIGITGFMKWEEVCSVSIFMPPSVDLLPGSLDRILMVGVSASLKTLRGRQNKWPNRYPKVEEISKIFCYESDVLNLIHYNTDEKETLAGQLDELIKHGGPNLHGFQLNIAWPSPIVLVAFRLLHPNKVIVLQVGSRAFQLVGHSPARLAKKVQDEYQGLIDYILLDSSGGLGKIFEPERFREYLQALQEKNLGIGLGVAGGLSAATLGILEPLAKDFPDLSIDAEGRLRDKNDCLDVVSAIKYVSVASQIFKWKPDLK